ncbi:hypothetical protein NS303_15320 [Pantoea ananatis]|nr:hypothetical protein NS303_15320 [Pantoea ananatis]KTR52744.1 hypothetical protein NS311_19820 [Pantoea ananatis]KTR64585.1 hypothetical protein RSA47_11605 [Pantoea ananatis]KTR69345.1 hypothetical protein NS296_16215 [Pantoea ananatis]MDC7862928.1 hypothetical protein [Pantoea ananatis]
MLQADIGDTAWDIIATAAPHPLARDCLARQPLPHSALYAPLFLISPSARQPGRGRYWRLRYRRYLLLSV